jgi:HlyD family secretion protein
MERKKKRILIFLIIFLGMIVVFGSLLLVQKREKMVSIYTADVKRGDLTAKVSAFGRVQPKSTVDISASVMGEIVKLAVEEGQNVKKGDFLLQLDKTEYESRVEQAQAGWKAAKANVKLAKANLEKLKQDLRREKQLLSQQLTSQETVDALETQLSVQEATYEAYVEQAARAEAAMEEAKDSLRKTTIYAPMTGIISQLNAEVGEVVIMGTMNNPGTVIMTISDMSIMEVEAEVDESDIVDVELNQAVEITVDAIEDSIIKGVVSEIGNTGITFGRGTQEEVTNFMVTVTVTDTSTLVKKLRPGMSATIDIITDTRVNTLYVPIQSVLSRTEKQVRDMEKFDEKKEGDEKDEEPTKGVFIVTDETTAQFVPVVTGISDETDIEIVSGVEEGQQVIAGSYKALRNMRNGKKLKIIESPLDMLK